MGGWGALFQGLGGAVPRNDESKANSYTKAGHSVGCRMLGDDIVLMSELDVMLQEHILECPHRSHDAVKFLFRDAVYFKGVSEPIEEGRLF